jgi:hypothetical protein
MREHVESPSATEISRRNVSAPQSGQLIRVVYSRDWKVECVVWDQADWERIPDPIRGLLIDLKREFAKTQASRFLVSIDRRG